MREHASRIGLLLLLVAFVAPGCNNQRSSADSSPKPDGAVSTTSGSTEQQANTTSGSYQDQQASTDLANKNVETAKAAPKPKPKPAPPRVVTLSIPAGTAVVASLVTPLNSGTNKTGDAFTATTDAPIVVDGKTAIPAGALIHGVLQDVAGAGRVKGKGRMTLTFQQITDAQGTEHMLSAGPVALEAEGGGRGDVERIAGGGVAGAIIGGLTGGKKGAAIGSAVGAGAGTALVLATRGADVELAAGQKINIQTTAPLSIALKASK
jgi:hypothetical protein